MKQWNEYIKEGAKDPGARRAQYLPAARGNYTGACRQKLQLY